MALHNLKIVVVDGGRNGSYKSKNAGVDTDEKDNSDFEKTLFYKVLHGKKIIRDKLKQKLSPTTLLALDMGAKVVAQTIKQTANYYISDIGRKQGDDNFQAIINRQIEVITDPLSIIGGAISGATAGSLVSPIGTAIGAVLGATSSAISLGIKYAERDRNYQYEMFQQNNGIAYNISRANFNALAGRVR